MFLHFQCYLLLLLIFFSFFSCIHSFGNSKRMKKVINFVYFYRSSNEFALLHIYTHTHPEPVRTSQKLNETIAFVCVYNSRWREVCLLSFLITKNVCVAFFRIIISRFVQVLVIVRATSETFKPHNRIETGNSFLCSNKSNSNWSINMLNSETFYASSIVNTHLS